MEFEDSNGRASGMHFQVAGITQPLISVAGLVDAGNLVVFAADGGWVHHQSSGRRVRLPRVGNTFVLDMKVAESPEEEKEAVAAGAPHGGGELTPAFRRPE